MKQAGLLAGATVLLGLILACLAYWLTGELGVVQVLTALIICLIPAVGTSLWRHQAAQSTSEMQLMAVLGGSGIRMAVVLGCGLLLYWNLGDTYTDGFWIWLMVLYFFTLTIELTMAVRGNAPTGEVGAGKK